jgi:hypothetical protein
MVSFVLLLCLPLASARTVLVTGATGQTGIYAYKWLQQQPGIEVRALVRNTSIDKARTKLGCTKCDESEGIYTGDVTAKETLTAAMTNVDVLLTAVGSNSNAKGVIYEGTLNQIEAFALAPGPALQQKQIVKVSAALTTVRFNILDIFTRGAFFYHGVSDQDVSVSGLPFTIVQPCRLGDDSMTAHASRLLVSHDDKPTTDGLPISGPGAGPVSRADVGRIAAYAATHPNETTGLKFDLCADSKAKPSGTEEEDMKRVFQEALFPWDPRAKKSSSVMV